MAFINLLDFGQMMTVRLEKTTKNFVINGNVHNGPMYQNEKYAVFHENVYQYRFRSRWLRSV